MTIRGQATVSATIVVGKDIGVAVRGFTSAVERLAAAVGHGSDGSDAVYIAIAEAMNWLHSLTEGRKGLRDNRDVQAVLFARNRTHHHFSSIAYFDEAGATHVWRPAEQLPGPPDPRHAGAKQKPIYAKRLAQQPVLDVFRRIQPLLATAS